MIEQTVASAETNMRSLASDLPPDGRTVQQAKRAEFYSLGLVLGYSYAGSPVVQPTRKYSACTDVTRYTPTTEPGARLPHRWLPDGSSLYDRLGAGFTLVGPVRDGGPGVAELVARARRRRIPLSLVDPLPVDPLPVDPLPGDPLPGDPRSGEFLLVRPDQHIAWRAGNAASIDLDLAAGHGSPHSRGPASARTYP